MMSIGNHLIIDLKTSDTAEKLKLADLSHIQKILQNSAAAAGATVLRIEGHKFGDDAGVTAFAMLAESHISVHTWPENGFAAFDIFMCGDAGQQLKKSVRVIQREFLAASLIERLIRRNYSGE